MDLKITKKDVLDKYVSVRIPDAISDVLKERAKKEACTVSDVVRAILEKYIYE
jgi:predicted DNA-binding protein